MNSIVAGTNGNCQLSLVYHLPLTNILTILSVIGVTAIEQLFGIPTLRTIPVEPEIRVLLAIMSAKAVFAV
jgi:hypothetical protein